MKFLAILFVSVLSINSYGIGPSYGIPSSGQSQGDVNPLVCKAALGICALGCGQGLPERDEWEACFDECQRECYVCVETYMLPVEGNCKLSDDENVDKASSSSRY